MDYLYLLGRIVAIPAPQPFRLMKHHAETETDCVQNAPFLITPAQAMFSDAV